jgi:hypothetical protein
MDMGQSIREAVKNISGSVALGVMLVHAPKNVQAMVAEAVRLDMEAEAERLNAKAAGLTVEAYRELQMTPVFFDWEKFNSVADVNKEKGDE